jgi:beta-lactamase class A
MTSALCDRVRSIAAGLDGAMGVYIRAADAGDAVAIDADRPFQMASVFKVPVLVELMSQASAGRHRLGDRVTLAEEMKAPGSGVLKELSPGTALTIRDLATLMIIVSDNTAADVLLDLVGKDAVNRRLAACGLTRTAVAMNCRELLSDIVGLSAARDTAETRREVAARLRSRRIDRQARAYRDPGANMTTPREMGRFLEQLLGPGRAGGGGALPAEVAQPALDIMRRQQVRDRLPLLLPPAVELAHKTGSVAGVSNDAGILYAPRGPVTVCVFTADLADDLKGRLAIAEVGRAVYDAYA